MLDSRPNTPKKYLSFVIFLIALIFVAHTYSKGLGNSFVLDDGPNINLSKIESLTLNNVASVIALNQSGMHPLSRAIPTASFSLTYLAHGSDVKKYRLHNLLLHLLCSIFVFVFINKFFLMTKIEKSRALMIASWAAAAWALHPLLVSTTLYAVQRITQFATLFTLLSLCSFITALCSISQKTKAINYWLLIPFWSACALMSKESAALIPAYVLVLWWIGKDDMQGLVKQDRIFILLFGGIGFALFLTVFAVKMPELLAGYDQRNFSLEERLLSQISIVFGYFKNLIAPQLGTMGLFLDDIKPTTRLTAVVLLKLIFLISIFVSSAYLTFRKNPAGILIFFFIGHIIESTIIPLELAFEHRNYFPSIALLGAVAFFISNIGNKLIKNLAFCITLSILALLLTLRVSYWSDEHEWQKTIISFHPNSVRAQTEHVNYLNKYFGADIAYEYLDKQDPLLDSATISIMKLIHLCGVDIDSMSESTSAIQRFDKLTSSKNITVIQKAMLMQLTEKVFVSRCSNINTEFLYTVVDAKISDLENRGLKVGSIYGCRGDLLMAGGFVSEASRDYVKAYESTKKIGFIMRAVIALAFGKNTFSEAEALAEKINNGTYFWTRPYKVAIDEMNNHLKLIKEQRQVSNESMVRNEISDQ